MKTATITYHSVYNYGAVLQTYALQQAQLNMSIDYVIIDYSAENNKIYTNIKGKTLKIFIINILRILETAINIKTIKGRAKNFNEFSHKRLHLTRKYHDYEDLKNDPPEVDWYIAGSDQLWNVSVTMKDAFFLDFAPPNAKRATYAVSMGSYQVPLKYKNRMFELISKFDAISVREEETQKFVENLLNKSDFVKLNLDPVFLLSKEDWTAFGKVREIGFKYILCYPLAGHRFMNEALKKLKHLTGYKVVVITTDLLVRIKGDVYIKNASPEEFIYLVQHAEYVLTASFHGTAFSALFEKKFYSFLGSSPARITGLLKRLGIENRIARCIDDINTDEIDFTHSNVMISKEIENSKEYLLSLYHHSCE